MRNALTAIYAALSIALMLGVMAGLNIASAQSPVDYDADNDGLIEIEWLEQLNAVRWDLNGDGAVDDGGNAEAYSAAFPNAPERMGCTDGCRGYELTRDLNFKSGSSYAAHAVNSRWTRGNGWVPIGINDSFRAAFEGNGFTISNLYIDRVGDDQPEASGLFARTGVKLLTWELSMSISLAGGMLAHLPPLMAGISVTPMLAERSQPKKEVLGDL